MSARHAERPFSLGRNCCAFLLGFALVSAGLLAVSPAFHEHLHPETAHLCVVTLFAAGQCEAATVAPVLPVPAALPPLAILPLAGHLMVPRRPFFSLLEHAPPVLP